DVNLVPAPAQAKISCNAGNSEIALLERDGHIRPGIMNLHVAVARIRFDRARNSRQSDVAARSARGQARFLRNFDIQIDAHVAACTLLVCWVDQVTIAGLLDDGL